MRAWRLLHRPHLAHALRVAAVATVVVAVVYVAAAVALDTYVSHRVLWEVDQRLMDRLGEVSTLPHPRTVQPLPAYEGMDGAPVLFWWRSPTGETRALTDGAPPLPKGAARVTAGAVTTPLVDVASAPVYRFDATPLDGGWLVAGQDLAGPSHIVRVLKTAELILGPVLVLTVFASVVVISLQAVVPVEEARRKQLELAADASHELRTPVAVIQAELELAGLEHHEPPVSDTLEHIGRETSRLKHIVDDLLWLARFEAEPPPGGEETTDLAQTVTRCAERFVAVARHRGINLETVVVGEPVEVAVPHEWVDRLTGTLVDNACRYAAEGGTVRITVGHRAARGSVAVEDDGPGIPPEQQGRLFDRFHRADDQPGGAGLGLAIADSIVSRTGGRWRIGRSGLGGALMEASWKPAQLRELPPEEIPEEWRPRPAETVEKGPAGAGTQPGDSGRHGEGARARR